MVAGADTTAAGTGIGQRKQYLNRLKALRNERQSWDGHLRDVSDHFYPRGARWLAANRNSGIKQNTNIINSASLRALDVLAAGLMSGVTPRSRPWFRLTTPDPALAEFGSVKEWLSVVEQRIRMACDKSNTYLGFHSVYMALGSFGTAPMHVEADEEDVLRCYPIPVGRYCLANSAKLRVDTLYDELSMTVAQLVEQFGIGACSAPVRQMWERNQRDEWVNVLHVEEPNRQRQAGKLGPAGMAWRSCWMEMNGDDLSTFLRESGFEEFSVVAPRWVVTGEDVYGSSPAMAALGDAKALQLIEKRTAQAFDRIVNPPMVGPSSLLGQGISLVPGSFTAVDTIGPGMAVRPAIEVNPQALVASESKIARLEQGIRASMYADVWLMMQRGEGDPQKTAREVAELHDEKMQQLGPVTERLQDELLDPFIDRVFGILLRAGQIPPPPAEIQGMSLKVEYIGIMAQAQKLLGITGLERMAGFVGQLAAVRPDVLDKVNFDQIVDEYAGMVGIPPNLIRTDEQTEAIRVQRERAQQQQQQLAQAQQMANVAKTTSETNLGGDNGLSRMLAGLGVPPSTP